MSPISMTAQMPELGQPSVTFAPVIQPSEVINQNTINVEPTPVTVENNIKNEVQPTPVENNITVQPADVTVVHEPDEKRKKKVDLTVKRDWQGKIESAQGKIE